MAFKKPSRRSRSRRDGSRGVYSTRRARRLTIRGAIFYILAVAAVLTAIVLFILRSGNGVSMFENITGTVISPVENAFNTSARWVKDFFTNWRNYDKLSADYEALLVENERLSLRLSNMDEMERENESLSIILDAKKSYEELDPIYAKVIARDPGQWFDLFTLNRGTTDGVTEGQTVVTGDGLVGYIYESGLNYSKVRSIIDSRSAVACLVQRTRDNGIMRGTVSGSAGGAECYVYYLPNVNNIVPGDVIITSGTDGLYPKGLTTGEVIAVSQETSSEGSYVIVSPYVDFQHVEDVLILRTVIENAESLPVVATPTPAPAITPSPSEMPGDDTTTPPDDGSWSFPTIVPEPDSSIAPEETKLIELLPEDRWAE